MAWGRIIDIYVGSRVDAPNATAADTKLTTTSGAASTTKLTGINPDNGEQSLDCEIDVTRSNRMAKNTATVKVYNLNKQMRLEVGQKGQVIRIDAGYEQGGVGTIFYGQVDSAVSVLEGADYVTTINASHFRAKNLGFDTLYVSLAYVPGASLKQVVSDLGTLLGVAVVGLANADILLPNGWVYPGPLKGALAYVRDVLRFNGRDLFYDLAELVVYEVSKASEFEAVYLDKESGLLHAEPLVNAVREYRMEARSKNAITKARARMDKTKSADGRTRVAQSISAQSEKVAEETRIRARVKTLLDHRLRPNCLVTVKHEAVNGAFILDDVRFKADTFGKDFDCEGLVSRES